MLISTTGGFTSLKKLLYLGALSVLLLAGCGDSNSNDKDKSATEVETSNGKIITEGDIQKLYTDPKKYKGYQYDFIGKVFTTPEKDEDGVYLQVWADHENSELNTIVFYADPNFVISGEEYIQVSSTVKDAFEGENMLGGKVTAPTVTASELKIIDYATAVAPTISTIDVNETIDQHGFSVTVEKIEFAKPHTRVYLSITNNTQDNISFFSHSVKLVTNGSQYEEEYFYGADYPELQSDILPGVTTSGIITFDAMDSETTELQIHADGYSDDYDLDINPFVFNISK